jgi:hypothetical protein
MLHLGRYLVRKTAPNGLPTPPSTLLFGKSIGVNAWGMGGNGPDPKYPNIPYGCGCCFFVGFVHAIDAARADLGLPPSGLDPVALYMACTGYDPTQTDAHGNNPTDQGTDPVQGLNWLRDKGYIDAWCLIDNMAMVPTGFMIGKGLLIGMGCPPDMDDQFDAGGTFTITAGNPAPSYADHCVYGAGYNPNEIVTWGGERQCDPGFVAATVKQRFCIIAPGQLTASGMDEFGLDLAQLIADNELLKNA